MVEILNFKNGSTIIKLKAAVRNLNIRGVLMTHCGRDKNTENGCFLFIRFLVLDCDATGPVHITISPERRGKGHSHLDHESEKLGFCTSRVTCNL
jgi:hypothetical protein